MVTSTANSARTEVRLAKQNGISIGLGVFAKTNIPKNNDILVLEQPAIALVEEKQLQNICSGCYDVGIGGSIDSRRPGLVKACVQCKVVYYCNKVLFSSLVSVIYKTDGTRVVNEKIGKLAIHWNVPFMRRGQRSCSDDESCDGVWQRQGCKSRLDERAVWKGETL